MGKEIPASGKAASPVEVAPAIGVEVGPGVAVDTGVGVDVGVGVGVGMGVDVPHRQSVSAAQLGFLQTPGAPTSELVW